MLATWIQRFISFQERETNLKFYRLSGATFYNCSNTIYQIIKPFLDNKMSIFEEYGAFNIRVWKLPLNVFETDVLNIDLT